jgi:hypothetical protein
LKSNHRAIPEGPLELRAAFFNPEELFNGQGIEPLLRGLSQKRAQEVDLLVVDDVRNFLFGPPGAGGFDLPALNIQRGRDHGLAGYNEVRRALGLSPRAGLDDVTSRAVMRARLHQAYANVEQVDLWVGGLAEDPLPGAMVGETIATIVGDQFDRLRHGDRFYYEAQFPADMVEMIERQTLAVIIRRNTKVGRELSDTPLFVP